jgi:small-conductance mechanosensitive channel
VAVGSLTELWSEFLLFMPRLALAVVIFMLFWLAARINRGVVQRFGQTKHLSPDIVNLLEQITEVTLLVFGAVTAFGTLGVDVGAMIASLGLVGFALGFALKDLLSNFLAGLLILIYNPFVRGDTISVSGNEGRVSEVNLRYTILQTDNTRVLIPNATLFSNPVIVQKGPGPRLPGSDLAAE